MLSQVKFGYTTGPRYSKNAMTVTTRKGMRGRKHKKKATPVATARQKGCSWMTWVVPFIFMEKLFFTRYNRCSRRAPDVHAMRMTLKALAMDGLLPSSLM